MAGYTPRNFLTLTIPSIIGLSILWFLKKRSSNSKQRKQVIQFEDTLSDNHNLEQYPILYPMKIKHQENNSVEETVNAEMQLKEIEPTVETQCQIPNGVSHNQKFGGRLENMSRLHENGNSCSRDEPVANGYLKDNTPHRNGDSNFELTNGMNALCLNGESKAKEHLTNGTDKYSEMEKMSNGLSNTTNGFENSPESCSSSEIQTSLTEDKSSSRVSVTDAEINKSLPEDFDLAAAKEQTPLDDHVQSSSVCNGVVESSSSSMGDTLPTEKLLSTLSNHQTVVVSNGLQSSKISSTTDNDLLTDTDKKLIKTDNPECEETNTKQNSVAQSVCVAENLDEHFSQSPKPDDTELSSSTSHSLIVDATDHPATPVNYIQTDIDTTLPINVVTDTEYLEPLVDYVVADSTELLTLPIDDAGAEVPGEMLESPGATYCDSLECHPPSSDGWYSDSNMIDSFFTTQEMEYHLYPWSEWWHTNMSFMQEMGSSDSGRGASETPYTLTEDQLVYMVYEFEIFPEDCGRLIGRLGRHVKHINKQTNANIVIKKHPCCTDKKLCAITGTETEINAALKLIRKRFPVEHYPSVTLAQINSIPISTLFSPETLKLSLPEGGVFDALLCSTVNAGHFFLQQPTHPTFYQLPPLTNAMNALYGQTETPVLENPTRGNICAAEIGGGWYRAEVDEVYEDSDNCRLKFLDYGGYADIPKASIRKIKCDFMLIPFQATECYLAGVMPLEETGWSTEATGLFEQEAQGQLIQGCIVAYAENRVPCVNLYKITGVESVFINQKLINDGFAKGIDMD